MVYVGNDPAALTAFERWLGRETDGVQIHTGSQDWEDWVGSIGWAADRWALVDRPIHWSIPMMAQGSDLGAVATDGTEGRYLKAAERLALTSPGPIPVRTGWEFNGDWMHWSAVGRAEDYVAAYRRFVDAFRSVSTRFTFEWCCNIGDHGMNPELAYPGDRFVDIIGMDFYYDMRWTSADPIAAWEAMVNRRFGLRWHQDFARSRGKPTAYSEWGVETASAAPYVQAAAEWFREHPVVYHCYWNSNAAFPGKLSDGQYPGVGAAFRELFGRDWAGRQHPFPDRG